ncbi:hypothetical protein PF008_g1750 [Phytophthora fragariae]|uniref:DDE-1 domain-containing protein n=1 Tax=Phytophthora fragariae TaxID=53985 RepID=A0A6G0SJS1_9STRA|nr:hypothetical protein PF008_g1750 [Phytophthora fragariae]
MLLADSTGKKYPPFLIFKGKPSKRTADEATNKTKQNGFGSTNWNEVKPLQATTGCQIYGNATAWWTAEMSIEFLRFHFANREAPVESVLLLWDDFSGHWTEEVDQYAESIGVVLEKVPRRYTFVCQPADISWNNPLKDVLRKRWVQNLQEQITEFQTLVEQQKRDAAQARALEDEARRRASIAHGVTPRDVSPDSDAKRLGRACSSSRH